MYTLDKSPLSYVFCKYVSQAWVSFFVLLIESFHIPKIPNFNHIQNTNNQKEVTQFKNRRKIRTDTSWKKIYRYQIITWNVQPSMSLENCKSKQQCDFEMTKVLSNSYSWWKWKMLQPLWETFWQFLAKLSVVSPYGTILHSRP